LRSEPRPATAFCAAVAPPVLWTMTWSFASGVLSAFASRPGATYVPLPLAAQAEVAEPRSASAATRTLPPRRPQVVLGRERPFGPLPLSVLVLAP